MVLATFSLAENGLDAAEAINASVRAGGGGEQILNRLDRLQECLPEQDKRLVQSYIVGIRPAIKSVLVEPLDVGVGGECDARGITIATASLEVDASVAETIERTKEVRAHEQYHRDNAHVSGMIVEEAGDGRTIATIGGHAFTQESLLEGVTVVRTGQKYVSQEYVQFAGEVRSAVAAAGISLE